ncbi:hypothetical protein CDL15_Pgr014055 [Punica granatum]|uniref:Uncharacterized protein n=1 Tax=Punica granatum TaxID=22663 RepID=A0A218W9Q6_PUNGR|nr:hypothetical protein CDL15_Pgr014055 [Punica granatum]
MSSASWSGHVGAGPSPEEKFHPPALTISGVDLSSPSSSSVPGSSITQAFHFSSGNPRIEETRGVMHLFPEDGVSCSSANPLPVFVYITHPSTLICCSLDEFPGFLLNKTNLA